jgi:beta-mannosidase
MSASTVIDLSHADWRVRPYHPNEADHQQAWKQPPTESMEIPAKVPGDVVTDVISAESGPHPYVDRNNRQYEWIAQRDWLYRLDFDAPTLHGRDARIEFEAVDYRCTVWLNGVQVGGHQGASDAFAVDVSQAIQPGRNRLHVLVRCAEPEPGQIGRTSEVRSWKPRFAYGWDWNCRLIPLGIWGPVRLRLSRGVRIDDMWWRSRIADDLGTAEVILIGSLHSDSYRWVKARGTLDCGGPMATERPSCMRPR